MPIKSKAIIDELNTQVVSNNIKTTFKNSGNYDFFSSRSELVHVLIILTNEVIFR